MQKRDATWHRASQTLLTLLMVSSLACAPDGGPDDAGPGVHDAGTRSAMQTVGAEGGTIALGEASLEIPAGSLSGDEEITITESAVTPDGYVALSPLYTFAPEGLVFALPVTVTLPFSGGSDPAVYWSKLDDEGYDELGGAVSGSTVTTSTSHFSTAFVGEAGGPSDGGVDGGDGDVDAGNGVVVDGGPASDGGSGGLVDGMVHCAASTGDAAIDELIEAKLTWQLHTSYECRALPLDLLQEPSFDDYAAALPPEQIEINCIQEVEKYRAFLATGNVVMETANMATCAIWFRGNLAECDLNNIPAACAELTTGTVADHEACSYTEECANEEVTCFAISGDCGRCGGPAFTYVGLDAACDSTSIFCAPENELFCAADNTCQALPGAGEACTPGELCDFDTAYCYYATSQCLAFRQLDESCSFNGQENCRRDLYCSEATLQCKAFGEAGDTCAQDGSLRCNTDAGLVCVDTLCTAPPFAQNESCQYDSQCGDGLFCSPYTDYTCQPVPQPNDPCDPLTTSTCGNPEVTAVVMHCVHDGLGGGICLEPIAVAEGEPCGAIIGEPVAFCLRGLTTHACYHAEGASQATCQPRKALGATCGDDDECQRDAHCYQAAFEQPATCRADAKVDEACEYPGERCNGGTLQCEVETSTCQVRTNLYEVTCSEGNGGS